MNRSLRTLERLGFVEPPAAHHRARRLAVLQGFSLHADTAVHGHDRQGLERLCRYGARGPVAESRLQRLDDGRYEYSPKKGSAFTLTAGALVGRLVALLPPARLHLTSFHGAWAPNARLRPLVTQPLVLQQPPAPTHSLPLASRGSMTSRTFKLQTTIPRCMCGKAFRRWST